ncbi:MAG: hypothetical protein JSU06_06485 [Actinobacteria bacterium]|nr:hypothetical protein [Actinomycetota bacterium]
MNTRKSIGLLALVAALGALAVSAASASATVVTPAATAVTITQKGQSPGFVTENAFATTSVQCKKASATFTTPSATNPPANNKNQVGVGTQSTANGSVTWDSGKPAFEECAVYSFAGGKWTETAQKAVVATNETSGKWTVSATNGYAGSGAFFITIPPKGATIELTGTGCTITVSEGRPTAVGGIYLNLTKELQVDGQVPFTSTSPIGCGGVSPAQFEAQFTANSGFEIN